MDHLLNVFVAVVNRESFSRAAEELHMTQSAVSLDIKALEKRYGIKLLERSNKYVRLTKAGEIVYYHATDILNQYAHVHRLIEDLKSTATGTLTLGASYTIGEYLIPRILSGFYQLYPQITPSITIHNTAQIVELILQHKLELAIIEGEVNHPKLLIHPFTQDELVVIVPSSSKWKGRIEVEALELAGQRWIIREKGSGTRDFTDQMFKKSGIVPEGVMEFGSSQVIKESVEAGLGISFISESAIQKELVLDTLIALRIKNHRITRNYSIVFHASQFKTKAVQLFLSHLSQLYPSLREDCR